MSQGFSHFSGILHHFVLATLATSSIRVKLHLGPNETLNFKALIVCRVMHLAKSYQLSLMLENFSFVPS